MAVCRAFRVSPPDADGDVWLHFDGITVAGSGSVNLGKPIRIAAQVAADVEQWRKHAVAP